MGQLQGVSSCQWSDTSLTLESAWRSKAAGIRGKIPLPRPKRIIIQDVANAWQLLPELKLQASSSLLWRAQGTDSRVPSLTGHMKESDPKIPNWSQRTKGNVLEEPPYRVHCPSFSNMVRAGYGTCGAPKYGRSGGFPGLKWGVGGWVRKVSVPSYQCMLRKCK